MDKRIIEYFKKVDLILHAVTEKIAKIEIWKTKNPDDYFVELCEVIIGQQLSGKAADTIYSRFEKLFGRKKITPENVLKIADQKLRSAGMAWSKVKYIKDLAQKILDKTLKLKSLHELPDELV